MNLIEPNSMDSFSNIKCLKCGGDTIHHISTYDNECHGYVSDRICCYSLHDINEEWYICKNCACLHLKCPNCSTLCKFVGHCGIFKNGTKLSWEFRIPNYELLPYDIANYFDSWYRFRVQKNTKNPNSDSCSLEFIQDYEKYLDDIIDINDPPDYYLGDQNIYYADPKEIFVTGPDGGMNHEWKCPSCSNKYSFTDK